MGGGIEFWWWGMEKNLVGEGESTGGGGIFVGEGAEGGGWNEQIFLWWGDFPHPHQ